MMRKINTKALVLLALLTGALAVYTLLSDAGKAESSLPEYLIQIKLTDLDRIEIMNRDGESYAFNRDAMDWKLEIEEGRRVSFETSKLESALKQIVDLQPLRLAGSSDAQLKDKQLTDSLATHVVLKGNGIDEHILVGSFSFDRTTQGVTNYVRMHGDDKAYLVKGSFGLDFSQGALKWRNTTVLSCNKSFIYRIRFSGDINAELVKDSNDVWTGNPMPDSLKLQNFLDVLCGLSSENFRDDMDLSSVGSPTRQIELLGSDGKEAELNLYQIGPDWFMNSASNTNFFSISETGRFDYPAGE